MMASHRVRLAFVVLFCLSLAEGSRGDARHPLLSVRLTTELSSRDGAMGDPLEAVLIASVPLDGRSLPAGWRLRGRVEEIASRGTRQRLLAHFHELVDSEGAAVPVRARIVEVDNAREDVDEDGWILGAPLRRLRPGKAEALLMLAVHSYPLALLSIPAARVTARTLASNAIHYRPGVELAVALERVPASAGVARDPASLLRFAADEPLRDLVEAQPVQSFSKRMKRSSDITNLMFVGSREAIEQAFSEAGWTAADRLGLRSAVKLLFAVAGKRSYRRAPMSRVVLEGDSPDLELQKSNNTVAKRHHIRIWRRPETYRGSEVWVGAATHDVAFDYASNAGKLVHLIDPRIDRERSKVVDDLLFTGRVAAWSLVARRDAPRSTATASGVLMETDGAMAVLVLE